MSAPNERSEVSECDTENCTNDGIVPFVVVGAPVRYYCDECMGRTLSPCGTDGGRPQIPPLRMTRPELRVLESELDTATQEATERKEDAPVLDSLHDKVQRIRRSVDTVTDRSGGQP